MATPAPSITQTHPSNEQWMSAPETEPLLDQDNKPESDTQPPARVDPLPAMRGISPIRLTPDQNLSEDYPFVDDAHAPVAPRWYREIPDRFDTIARENRSAFSDMGRGCLIIVTTPVAFVGVTLYAAGVLIEGVAMVIKGLGLLGGKLMMRRRQGSESPRPAIWV